jgi:putative SOS response-associated peptidase YedK
MCGRYSLNHASLDELYFAVHATRWSRSFNIAASEHVPVARIRNGQRAGQNLRWGLIPYFAKGEPPKFAIIDARIETG